MESSLVCLRSIQERNNGKGEYKYGSSVVTIFMFSSKHWPDPNFFKPETICTRLGIFPENLSSIDAAVLEELGSKQNTD